MKRLYFVMMVFTAAVAVTSCNKKDDILDVNLEEYNYDDFEAKAIDEYIYNNLTKPYNIEVVYRFDRSHTDVSKNISPPDINKIEPAVNMVRDGFLKIYEKVGGPTFIKTYTPKQFVLFGSHAYNSNGSVTLGTADGGRRVVLYDINNINASNSDNIKRRLRTIHHEFTHIVNQVVAIPPSFRIVTTDYVPDWLASSNTDAEALSLGFISPYSRSSFGEDFAETVAHLLVEGQAFYDKRIAASTPEGAAKLRAKQAIVEEYYKQYFNINFKELQYETYLALSQIYNDQSQTLYGALTSNSVNTITLDLDNASHYVTYGISPTFKKAWDDAKVGLAAYGNNGGRYPTNIVMVYKNQAEFQLQVTYRNPSNPTAIFYAYYDYSIQNIDGETKFTFVPSTSTETAYGNGRTIQAAIKPLLDYFTLYAFKAQWVSPDIVGIGNAMKFAGYYESGNEENNFYGPVTLK